MLSPGRLIAGIYEICHLIAEGGIAEVYLARCKGLTGASKNVAIKRLKPQFAKNRDLAQWFEEEAQLIISFTHPNLIFGIEYIREESEQFIVMEYVLGQELGQLSSRLKQAGVRMRVRIAWALGITLCDALIYLHEKNDLFGNPLHLIHGDISPQNIMVRPDGHIKLIDFGNAVATRGARACDASLLCGNMRYISPEQQKGSSLDPRSDIYSLALVMLEIMRPKDCALHDGGAKKLLNILLKAVCKKRAERFLDCHEFLKALKEMAGPVVREPSTILKTIWRRPLKKERSFLMSRTVTLLTTITLLIGFFMFSAFPIFNSTSGR